MTYIPEGKSLFCVIFKAVKYIGFTHEKKKLENNRFNLGVYYLLNQHFPDPIAKVQ